jgi:hypothetical protein
LIDIVFLLLLGGLGLAFAIHSQHMAKLSQGETGIRLADRESIVFQMSRGLMVLLLRAMVLLPFAIIGAVVLGICLVTTQSVQVVLCGAAFLLLASIVWIFPAFLGAFPRRRPRIFMGAGCLWVSSQRLNADVPEQLRFKHALPNLKGSAVLRARLVSFQSEANSGRTPKHRDASFALPIKDVHCRNHILSAVIDLHVPAEAQIPGPDTGIVLNDKDALNALTFGKDIAMLDAMKRNFRKPLGDWYVEVTIKTPHQGTFSSTFKLDLVRYPPEASVFAASGAPD